MSAPILQKNSRQRASSDTLLTIFSIPKPFFGHTGIIQRNAVRSWKSLGSSVDVVLIGDEDQIAETAAELGVRHIAEIEKNSSGTPLVSSAFQKVRDSSDAPILMYCNCDVILMPNLVDAIHRLSESDQFNEFVAIGRRVDLDLEEEVDFETHQDRQRLLKELAQNGSKASVMCKEFFAFPRSLYQNLPEFAVGRGNWDNWMVASARAKNIPIVDIAPVTTIIHQNHDYAHMGGNRLKCYVTGEEARQNQQLAGGSNLIRGCCSTWILTPNDLRRKKLRWAYLDFWLDTVPFLRLMRNMLISR